MQYSQSPDTVVHAPTGNRMHQDTAAVTSEITAQDLNQVNWSLMELLKDQGIGDAAFDPATPDTYQRVLQAIKKMVDTRSASPTIIDRTGLTATALLDRFDVIHKYRCDRAIAGNGNFPSINATTGLVQGGVYKIWCNTAAAGVFYDNLITLRPNNTTYANQFRGNYIDFIATTSQPAQAVFAGLTSSFQFDNFGGTAGTEGCFEMTVFTHPSVGWWKKVIYQGGDTASSCFGVGVWENGFDVWSTLGSFGFFGQQSNSSGIFAIEMYVRRVG